MAETNVPITAGSGTNIATYTDSAGNRQQIVAIGNGLAATAPVDSTKGLAVDLTASGSNTNPLLVTGTGGTFPVTGTFWQATQPVSGSFSFTPATSGGYSRFHLVAAGSTNATSVKASAGQLYGVSVFNNAAYPVYVKFYNTASTPTVGTGVVRTFGVQAGVGLSIQYPSGVAFATGIGLSITKGIADADATAVVASDCVVDVDYF